MTALPIIVREFLGAAKQGDVVSEFEFISDHQWSYSCDGVVFPAVCESACVSYLGKRKPPQRESFAGESDGAV